MSELKGQMLGMILVFAIFAVVGGVLLTAFSTSATQIASSMASEGSLITVSSVFRTLRLGFHVLG